MASMEEVMSSGIVYIVGYYQFVLYLYPFFHPLILNVASYFYLNLRDKMVLLNLFSRINSGNELVLGRKKCIIFVFVMCKQMPCQFTTVSRKR